MSQSTRTLASGPGWWVADIVCTAAAGDRPFEEKHGSFCVAAVTAGTFRYRSRQGSAVMAPGSLLLGNASACFECGHEHGRGDRCLSFHFSPVFLEDILAAVPGARRLGFGASHLPALPELAPLRADAEVARETGDHAELQEIGVRLAGSVATLLSDAPKMRPSISSRDEKRVARAVHLIESEAERPISLTDLADEAATSPFHFLRSFRSIAGMTPYQFLLKTRLHRAAIRLGTTDEAVSAIALDAGFNDLSTFNRQFKRLMGKAPGAWRAERRKAVVSVA